MPQPIPSYLFALAVGDITRRDLGPRTAVYAEPYLADDAAWEFAQTEQMLAEGEKLFGPYWDRYDMLVLPPSFPYGGMENPRLTFLTPTYRRRAIARQPDRPRAGPLLDGQPGDQRHLGGFLAQRRLDDLRRTPHH